MLVALTENQDIFQLTPSITETILYELRQTTNFYCRQCKEKLHLKIGRIKIPHFAHVKNSQCESLFSDGESLTHLLGKQQRFSFFQQYGNVQLEPYLQQLHQRPDLLLTLPHRRYAIEFQCSRIAPEVLAARTDGYIQHRITPLWLYQTPTEQMKQQGISKVSLNHFTQQFIQQQKQQQYIVTYDAHSQTFYYLSNLMPLQGNQFLTHIQPLALPQQAFPFYLPTILSEQAYGKMISRYINYKESYCKSRLFLSRQGINDLFLRSIYELRLSRESLPCFIGIPTRHNEAIPLFSVEWQMALFYFMHCHSLTPQTMNTKAIPYFFKWAKLPYNSLADEAVRRYIKLLKGLMIHDVYTNVSTPTLLQKLYDELVAISCEN